MAVRRLAWLNCIGLLLLAWLSARYTRAPGDALEQASRAALVLAFGLGFLGLGVVLVRWSAVTAKILLATPLVLGAAFLLGLMGAALLGPL